MTVKSEEIRSLLSFFEKSGWEELRIETGGVKIAVSKTGSLAIRGAAAPTAAATPPVADAPRIASPAAHPAARSPTPAGSALAPGQVYLRAPNLGVVWSLPKPGAPAFVVEGQLIEEGATV